MSPRSYALATILGWLLIVAGIAELVGRWFWGPGVGFFLLWGVGLRQVALVAWMGWQRMEDPEAPPAAAWAPEWPGRFRRHCGRLAERVAAWARSGSG